MAFLQGKCLKQLIPVHKSGLHIIVIYEESFLFFFNSA